MTRVWWWTLVATFVCVNIHLGSSSTNCTPKLFDDDELPPSPFEFQHPIINMGALDLNMSIDALNTSETNDGWPTVMLRVKDTREWFKLMRLQEIRSSILTKLGLNHTPNITESEKKTVNGIDHLTSILNFTTRRVSQDIFAKVQSFHPSCSHPNNTDRSMWEDDSAFHIFYNITTQRLLPSTSHIVSSAKLQLYKSAIPRAEPPPTVVPHTTAPLKTQSVATVLDCDERFRISVYQYTRPLKKSKRAKKGRKLIDSQMVSADFLGWVEFDIKTAIKDWLDNANKNLGLEVVLEDSMANIHNVADYFMNMNCSDDYIRSITNGTMWFPNKTFPTLELKTVEKSEPRLNPVVINVQQRRKRAASTKKCQNCIITNDDCVLKPVYVDMEDMEWHHSVVAPPGFFTGICFDQPPFNTSMGHCMPVPDDLPVLVPDDNGGVSLKILQNAVVKSCRREEPQ